MRAAVDVLVVGGGIHGAAIARAAASAGYSVVVLERSHLAAGASGRSTRLIHGGLRYLEHGQPRLVWESLRERRHLCASAPDLVRLIPMHIPVYADSGRGAWYVQAGLSAYALLGGLRADNRFRRLGPRSHTDLDGLRQDGLRTVFRYYEGQADDAALTRAVMEQARRAGAELSCPAEFLGAEVDTGGCEVRWRQAGVEQACRAGVLINATGAWTRQTAERMAPRPVLPPISLVQGAHLLLADAPRKGGYYLEAPQDRRPVFLLPWHGGALLGTTETAFDGNPDDVVPLGSEREYLLDVLGHYFPNHRAKVTGSYAGIRVLPGGNDNIAGSSRETQLVTDHQATPRLLTVLGGKLTTHRVTAARALALLEPTLKQRPGRTAGAVS